MGFGFRDILAPRSKRKESLVDPDARHAERRAARAGQRLAAFELRLAGAVLDERGHADLTVTGREQA